MAWIERRNGSSRVIFRYKEARNASTVGEGDGHMPLAIRRRGTVTINQSSSNSCH
jgi:hypothetical protein